MDAMKYLIRALALMLVACLAACSPEPAAPAFSATDVTGIDYARDFSLVNTSGKPVRLSDYRGKVVAVFFGYTHCPDACPTTMAELANAMKKLGARADKVQVMFVSVDPERDTPDVLAAYAGAFDPRFWALTGTPEAIARVAGDFKVVYRKVAGDHAAEYTIDHSAGTYLYDPDGRLRVYVPYGSGADVFAHDIGALIGPDR